MLTSPATYDYRKTTLTSKAGYLFARELKATPEISHIFRKGGDHPLFMFDGNTNQLSFIGGLAKMTPELMADLADFGKALYERNN